MTRPLVGSVMRREHLEQRALAGAVAADDAQHLALLHLEIYVLQGPEFFDRVALHDLPAAHHIHRLSRGIAQLLANDVSQCRVAMRAAALPTVADQVAL